MKAVLFVLCAVVTGNVGVHAQKKVTEKDLLRTWQMVIEDLENTKQEYTGKKNRTSEDMDASGRLEPAIESAVAEFVNEMVGGIDIRFTFLAYKKVNMEIDIMGEYETENLKWHINENGGVVLEDKDRDTGDEAWFG